jgi:hypothetical protein
MTEPKSSLQTNSPTEFTVNMADIAESPTHYSIPVVFTKEGVHNGYLKPYDAFKDKAKEFVGKPVIIAPHPVDGGQPRPVDVNRDAVTGEIESCEARDNDKSLHGRIKLVKTKTPAWLIQAVKNGQLRGGSPGYWHKTFGVSGVYQGKPYSGIETVTGWDHYAIGLPNGAAKVEDGVGLRFNSQQDDEEVPTMGKIKQILTEYISKLKPEKDGKQNMSSDEKRLEKLEKQIEELTAKNKDWETKFSGEEKARKEAETKLKTYTDKEEKAEQEKKDSLIKEIIEDTDEKVDIYKDWSIPQLELLKTKLGGTSGQSVQPPQQTQTQNLTQTAVVTASADKTALKPVAGASVVLSQPLKLSDTGKTLTIGNQLFGKKMGEV